MQVVNFQTWSCDCGHWAAARLPCMHVMACVRSNNEEIENYCHSAFFTNTYFKIYCNVIHPQPDLRVLPLPTDDDMLPPPLRRLPSRPRKTRRIQPSERLAT